MMTEREVSERWADMCRSAEQTGHSALRVVESHLLTAMQDLERARHEARRWIDVVNTTQRQVEGHRATIDQLRALLTPPSPKYGTTRAHGLHIMCPQTGKLIPVDVDYEADEETGIVPLYVWAGAHDISGWMRPIDEDKLAEQIAKRIKEDATEQRAEQRGEALKELRAAA